jgi:heme/copper-type cytochrome/quinol oxidase subunit 2
VLLLLVVLGSYSLWSGTTGSENLMAPYNSPDNNMIMGIVALTGFCILVVFLFVTSPPGRKKNNYRT